MFWIVLLAFGFTVGVFALAIRSRVSKHDAKQQDAEERRLREYERSVEDVNPKRADRSEKADHTHEARGLPRRNGRGKRPW